MRNKIRATVVIIAILISCKKDPADPVPEPAPSLIGSWKLESNRYIDYEDDILQNDQTVPGNGETFNFLTNGNLVLKHDGLTENIPYRITFDTLLDVGGFSYKIRNLTSSSVILYYRNDVSPGSYDQIEQRLKK